MTRYMPITGIARFEKGNERGKTRKGSVASSQVPRCSVAGSAAHKKTGLKVRFFYQGSIAPVSARRAVRVCDPSINEVLGSYLPVPSTTS
jgi:hypothetical protein